MKEEKCFTIIICKVWKHFGPTTLQTDIKYYPVDINKIDKRFNCQSRMRIPLGNDKTWNQAPGHSRLVFESHLNGWEGLSPARCVFLKGLHEASWSTFLFVPASELWALSLWAVSEKGAWGGPHPAADPKGTELSDGPSCLSDGLHLGRDPACTWVQEHHRSTPVPLPWKERSGSRSVQGKHFCSSLAAIHAQTVRCLKFLEESSLPATRLWPSTVRHPGCITRREAITQHSSSLWSGLQRLCILPAPPCRSPGAGAPPDGCPLGTRPLSSPSRDS